MHMHSQVIVGRFDRPSHRLSLNKGQSTPAGPYGKCGRHVRAQSRSGNKAIDTLSVFWNVLFGPVLIQPE